MSEINQEVDNQEINQEEMQVFNPADISAVQLKDMLIASMEIVLSTRPQSQEEIDIQNTAKKVRDHLVVGHADDLELSDEELNHIAVIHNSIAQYGNSLIMQANEMFALADVINYQFNDEDAKEDLGPVHPPMETL